MALPAKTLLSAARGDGGGGAGGLSGIGLQELILKRATTRDLKVKYPLAEEFSQHEHRHQGNL